MTPPPRDGSVTWLGWAGTAVLHRGRRDHAVLARRCAAPAHLRRDVLRQAGLVDGPVRLRDEGRPLLEQANRSTSTSRRTTRSSRARRATSWSTRRSASGSIGLGEIPFGILNSFGWRFAVALAGMLSILMVGRIARRLFQSDLLGAVAAALLAFEGHHFVHSRTGLLDIFVMFFGLAAFGALLIDRDQAREVLAAKLPGCRGRPISRWGPWLGWRPWRWVAGVMLGPGGGVKWSGSTSSSSSACSPSCGTSGRADPPACAGWVVGGVVKDGLFAFAQLVGTAFVTYVAELDGLDPHAWRLVPHLGRDAAVRRARRPAARLVAVAVGLPPADVRVERTRSTRRTPTRRVPGRG